MFGGIFNLNCIGWSSKHINDFSIHLIRSFILKLAYKNPKHMVQPLIVCYLFACSIEILSKKFHGTIGRMRFLSYAWAANNDCFEAFFTKQSFIVLHTNHKHYILCGLQSYQTCDLFVSNTIFFNETFHRNKMNKRL